MNLLFVYGSLKKNYVNHKFLFHSKYIKDIVLPKKGLLLMNDSRYYPHLVLDDNGNDINGELYEVSDSALNFIDNLEGHPDFFKRINLGKFEDYDNLYVYVYLFQRKENIDNFKIVQKY